jgi:predicted GIY-YIG superfamily endonuclease
MEKLFMKYVSTDIKNKLTNPIPELNKYTFNIQDYIDKEVLYLIHVKDNIYKFGITYDINRRLTRHKADLKYDYVIKCWDCRNRTVSKGVEDSIKLYAKINKLKKVYMNHSETIETNNVDKFVKVIDDYVQIGLKEYRKFIGGEEYVSQ